MFRFSFVASSLAVARVLSAMSAGASEVAVFRFNSFAFCSCGGPVDAVGRGAAFVSMSLH